MNTFYPIDLAGVKAIGAERWLNEFRPLIRGEEYRVIHKAVFDAYLAAIPRVDESPAVYWAAVINYKMVPHIAHAYFKHTALKSLAGHGFDSVGGPVPLPLATAVEQARSSARISPAAFETSPVLWLKENWRAVRTNHGCHSPLASLFPKLHDGGLFIVGDRNQREIRAYLADTGGNPLCLRPLRYLGGGSERLPSKDAADLTRFTRQFFDRIHKELPPSSLFLDNAFAADFSGHYERTIRAFNQAAGRLSGGPLGQLLITNVGNLQIRVLAAAWRHVGGKTIGFSHGNPYPYAYVPGDIINGSHLICDTYFASSKGEKKLLEQSREDFTDGFRTTAAIQTFENPAYKNLFATLQREPAPAAVKTVMIVGFPFDYFFSYTLPELNTMTYLRFEIDLIRSLKKSGFIVIYKAHPDTRSESAGIFEKFADRVETRSFENVYHDADCLLFPTHYSTTFGFSLMTSRPVVLMANPKGFWHPEAHALLKKRCALAEMSLDGKGVLTFDDDALRDAVERSVNHMDYQIVKEYAV